MNSKIVYKYKNNLYINLTNRCSVKCLYCIKYRWKWWFRGNNLLLKKEPNFEEIIAELKQYLQRDKNEIKEIVFCGYGEPLLRFSILLKVAKWIKNEFPKIKIRVNTNGLGNVSNKQNVCPKLRGFIDSISVSLNAENSTIYNKLHKTSIKNPFNKIIKFIKTSKKYFDDVIITTTQHPQINLQKVKQIAKKLNVKFRLRRYLDEYENK